MATGQDGDTRTPEPGESATRFYGRVELDPVRFLRQMNTISEELVARLGDVGAKLHSRSSLRRNPRRGFPMTFSGRSPRTRRR